MTNEQTNITAWAMTENNRLDEEHKKAMKEKGQSPFYEWRNGDNRFTINSAVQLRDKQGDYGAQKIFQITANDEVFDMSVNIKSPLYRMIVKGLSDGKFQFNINKSGQGLKVRYELLEAL